MTAKHVESIKEIVFGSNNVVNDLVAWHEGEIKRILEPIIKAKNDSSYAVFNDKSVKILLDGIKETLQLANLQSPGIPGKSEG